MLETLVNLALRGGRMILMRHSSIRDNASSADNQQERLRATIDPWFISGFVDGEGSFHVAVARRTDLPRKWVIIPEFHVSQHRDRAVVLRELQQFFDCGSIRANHAGRSNDVTEVFVVRNRHDLLTRIIPFFKRYPMRSSKQQDFVCFAHIVTAMEAGQHQTYEGFRSLVIKAFQMNGGGRYRTRTLEEIVGEESSETTRQGQKIEGIR